MGAQELEGLKKRVRNSATYLAVNKLFTFIYIILFSMWFQQGIGKGEVVIPGELLNLTSVHLLMLPPVLSFFFISYNCSDYYVRLFVLVDEDSSIGNMLSLVILLLFIALIFFSFISPGGPFNWLMIAASMSLLITVKSFQTYLTLDDEHPFKKGVKRTSGRRRSGEKIREGLLRWAKFGLLYTTVLAGLGGLRYGYDVISNNGQENLLLDGALALAIMLAVFRNKYSLTSERIMDYEEAVEDFLQSDNESNEKEN